MAAFVEPLFKVEGKLDFANEVSKIETVNKKEEEENTEVFEGSAKDTEKEEEEELRASEKGQVEFPGGKIDSDVSNPLNDDAVLPSNEFDLRSGKRENLKSGLLNIDCPLRRSRARPFDRRGFLSQLTLLDVHQALD